jgi:hypothetical protein
MPISTSPDPISAPHPELEPPVLNPSAYGFSTGPNGVECEDDPCEKFYGCSKVSRFPGPFRHTRLTHRLSDNNSTLFKHPRHYGGIRYS